MRIRQTAIGTQMKVKTGQSKVSGEGWEVGEEPTDGVQHESPRNLGEIAGDDVRLLDCVGVRRRPTMRHGQRPPRRGRGDRVLAGVLDESSELEVDEP
jgi:hypothetical protein